MADRTVRVVLKATVRDYESAIDRSARKTDALAAQVDRLSNRRITATVDVDTAAASTRVDRMRRHLEGLDKARATPKVDADTAVADARIREIRSALERLGAETTYPELGIKTATFRREVADIRNQLRDIDNESADPRVTADTAAARAQLRGVDQSLDNIDGRTARATVRVDGAQRANRQMSSLLQVGLALGPSLVPVAGALTGALAGTAGTLGAVAAGAGTTALAFGGVGDALDAMSKADLAASGNAKAAAAAQVAAAQRVADARRGLADAHRDAARAAQDARERVADAARSVVGAEEAQAAAARDGARQVADAQATLAAAHDRVRYALDDLHEARAQSLRDLQDLRAETRDHALDVEGAEVSLAEARQRLAEVNRDWRSSDLDLRSARLGVAEAENRLSHARKDSRQHAKDLADAERKGVAGSERVVAARGAVADAQRGVQAAERGLSDARVDAAQRNREAARRVADAQRGLASAERDATQSRADSARRVADAQRGVSRAVEGLRKTMSSQSTEAENLAEKMGALSPAGRKFVRFLHEEMGPAVKHLRDIAQTGLFPGVEAGLSSLLEIMPDVEQLVSNVAEAMGALAREGGDALTSPFWRDFIDFTAREAKPTLKTFGRILGNLAEGLAGMVMAFDPLADDMGDALLGLARDFAKWGAELGDSEGFHDFVDYVRRVSPKVWETLGAVATALLAIVEAAAPVGEVSLPIIRELAHLLEAIADSPAGTPLFAAATGMLALNSAMRVFDAVKFSRIVGLLTTTGAAEGVVAGAAGAAGGAGTTAATTGAATAAVTRAGRVARVARGGIAIGATLVGLDLLNDAINKVSRSDENLTIHASGATQSLIHKRIAAVDAVGPMHAFRLDQDSLTRAVANGGASYRQIVKQLRGYSKGLYGGSDATRATREKSAQLADTLVHLRGRVKGSESAMVDARFATVRWRQRMDDLNDAVGRNQANIGRTQAIIDYRDTVRGLGDALDRSNGSLDTQTVRGAQSHQSLLNAASAAESHRQAVIDDTGSVQQGNRVFRAHRREIIATLVAHGVDSKRARALADDYLHLTRRVVTAETAKRNYRSAVDQVSHALGLSRGQTLKLTDAVETSRRKGESQKQTIDRVAKALGINRDEAAKLIRKYGDVPADVKTQIRQPGMDTAQDNLRKLDRLIRDLPDHHVTVGVLVDKFGKAKARSLLKQERAMANRPHADGGITDYHADGALRGAPAIGGQQPQIQANRGPRGIVWAETGAGPWEAFVSGHPAKRTRSRAIASETVRRLGGHAEFADGGMVDMRTNVAGVDSTMRDVRAQVQTIATTYFRNAGRIMSQALLEGTGKAAFFVPWAPWHRGDGRHVGFRGVTVNRRTRAMLRHADDIFGGAIDPTQGSYSTSVAASGSTHAGGGAVDIGPAKDALVRAMRMSGFAAWRRRPSEGPWGPHIHAIAVGDPTASSAAKAQVAQFFHGQNGLGRPDTFGALHGAGGKLSAAERWIIGRESSGDVRARNGSHFGIGQLSLDNRLTYGDRLGVSPWTTSYKAQLAMMRMYIADRYGNAENAKRFWASHNWYSDGGIQQARPRIFDGGGYLKPGVNVAVNHTGGRERVLDREETAAYDAGARMASGGILDFSDENNTVPISDLVSAWAAHGGAPVSKGDLKRARRERDTEIRQRKSALREMHKLEEGLARARRRGNPKAIAAAERDLAKARKNVTTQTHQLERATNRLYRAQQLYGKGRTSTFGRTSAALTLGNRTSAAFSTDLEKITARGHLDVAQQLLALGGPEAQKYAHDLARAKGSRLDTLSRQIKTSIRRQQRADSEPGILAITDALRTMDNPDPGAIASKYGLSIEQVLTAATFIPALVKKDKDGKALAAALHARDIKGFASGTLSAPRGWAIVGEEGPELRYNRGGEQIYDAARTTAILGALGQATHRPTPVHFTGPAPRGGDGAAAPTNVHNWTVRVDREPIEAAMLRYQRDADALAATERRVS